MSAILKAIVVHIEILKLKQNMLESQSNEKSNSYLQNSEV